VHDVMAVSTLVLAGLGFGLGRRQLRREKERSRRQALHDPVTDLANRPLLYDRVAVAYRRVERLGEPFSLLSVDLHSFKDVNDAIGHRAGDDLLRAVAARLCQTVRHGDTVARIGADEFAILLSDCAADCVGWAVSRVRAALNDPFTLAAGDVELASTIGVAAGCGASDPDELVRNAHLAIERGRRTDAAVAVFEPEMHRSLVDRIDLERELRRSVAGGSFTLHYQPILETAEAGLHAFEALIRWDHPARGRVSPGEFIPLAERTGLIGAIGDWVLREAIRQLAAWRAERLVDDRVAMSVNVSARQLEDADFARRLSEHLTDHRLPARNLIIEITESVLMQQAGTATAQLQATRRLGVAVALDDFGTGYSSLARLAGMPVDCLKVDRSFVDALLSERRGHTLPATIIGLGHSLGLSVVAEGVETAEQLSALRRMRCDLVQGFFLAPPLPAHEAIASLHAASRPPLRSARCLPPISATS
jgi:diguanylate cyclase (GGDEF)-like protein